MEINDLTDSALEAIQSHPVYGDAIRVLAEQQNQGLLDLIRFAAECGVRVRSKSD